MNPTLSPEALLLDLTEIPEEKLEVFARQKFRELCIDSNGRGMHQCHDGEAVVIWESRFEHAFFKPENWKDTSQKQVLDRSRIQRTAWIVPLIGGEFQNSECWLINERGRLKRMYTIRGTGYVVWLEFKYEGLWTFSTGYVANTGYIYKQTRGQKRIWKK